MWNVSSGKWVANWEFDQIKFSLLRQINWILLGNSTHKNEFTYIFTTKTGKMCSSVVPQRALAKLRNQHKYTRANATNWCVLWHGQNVQNEIGEIPEYEQERTERWYTAQHLLSHSPWLFLFHQIPPTASWFCCQPSIQSVPTTFYCYC